jgi:uncharacterized protein YbjT (DUF2867 family)
MKKKILVIGGTGMLGKPVVQELINSGYDVTLFSTKASEATKLFPRVKVIEGNIKYIDSIENAMVGQDAVYMNLAIPLNAKSSDWNPEIDGLKNILDAAKTKSIKQIGYLSPLIRNYSKDNKRWWYLQDKKRATEMIEKSGIPYFLFTASNFMENFLASSRRGNAINTIGSPQINNHYICGSDYGKQVAKAFSLDPLSKEFFIQGPEAINPKDAVKQFTENYTKESLKPGSAPMGMLKFIGCFSTQIGNVAKLMTALNEFPEEFKAKETWEILGKPTTTIKNYAKLLSIS